MCVHRLSQQNDKFNCFKCFTRLVFGIVKQLAKITNNSFDKHKQLSFNTCLLPAYAMKWEFCFWFEYWGGHFFQIRQLFFCIYWKLSITAAFSQTVNPFFPSLSRPSDLPFWLLCFGQLFCTLYSFTLFVIFLCTFT